MTKMLKNSILLQSVSTLLLPIVVFGLQKSWKLLGWVFTYGKIDACDAIHDDKDVGICELVKAVIQAHRKHEHHQL